MDDISCLEKPVVLGIILLCFLNINIFALVTYRQSVVGLDLFSLIREPNLCNVQAYRFHCYEQSAALFTGSLVNI